ncbi:MAG: hypothetical protein HY721_12110 [Planctomycetes bacterium]|nr:hypothetical protein [Planctomycetota bacterium]
MSFDARAGGYAPGPPGAGSAEAAYAQYRRRLELGEALDFDEFCAGRPELAPALQALHSVYAGGPVQEESSFAKVIEENLVPPVPSGEAPVLPGAETLTLPDRPAAGERSRLPPGRRYRFQEEVARGGMGVILKAWDEVLNRPLAVKVLLRPGGGGSDDPDMLRRFLEEAQITGQLEHPGIVPVHELGVNEDGRPYFAMRLVKGRNLGEVFALARAGQEAWSLPRAIGVLVKVCEAVAYAHA